jgi:uncharacterized Zn finger protein (UPF0148 family)
MSAATCACCGTPLVREISRGRGVCSECHNRQRFPQQWAEVDKRRVTADD